MQTRWDLLESPENIHGVPKRQWVKWPNAARMLFNQTLEGTADRVCYAPPPGPAPAPHLLRSLVQWRAIRWHTAWCAADNLARMLKTPGPRK
jgi:hypothetical protein